MVDVFISYSRANQPVVRQLAEKVKELGYSVWWDDELPPHLSYSDVIAEKIGSAKAAIVVWSEGAASSEWVRAEADLARSQKKLIQTSIDGRMPPMPFNQIQFASIGDWHGEDDHPGWMKVKASLEALCGAQAQAARIPIPATPPPPAAAPRSGSKLVPALIGGMLLVVLAFFYLLLARGGGAPSQAPIANQAAPQANQVAAARAAAATPATTAEPDAATPITDAQFTEAATVDAPAGAEIRSGPAADAFLVANLAPGALVTTFPQAGDWWQVRAPNGAVGYLPHSQLRLMSTAAAHPAPAPVRAAQRPAVAQRAPAPPPAAQAPKPMPGQPQVLNMPVNPRRYCNGPGRGTPECAQLRQRLTRPRAYPGGY
jgi:hypothetical protein